MTYEFIFDIKAQAKERPRFSNKGGTIRTYTAEKTRSFESTIAVLARQQMAGKQILVGLLVANVVFEFEKPKRTSLLTPKKDLDNLQKSIFDSLNGVVFTDDTQIVQITAYKRWSTKSQIRLLIGKQEENDERDSKDGPGSAFRMVLEGREFKLV